MTRLVALCGYPQAGKSQVQRILTDLYGLVAVDDARPLREAVCTLYGLTPWHVETQAGKSSLVPVGDTDVEVRTLLAELGAHLEARDPFHKPRTALARARAEHPGRPLVFGSVRQGQARFLRDQIDTLVVEVTRPGVTARTPYDRYDRDAIDFTIANDSDLDTLARRVRTAFDPVFGASVSIAAE